ncbi:MAG: hypothetical protein QNJ12_14995 [Ilumatobacter sp.]|uniref:hypothetical protein n=1 Tax=Ilumatobacter sp. TaxID=1967498 RepID=UPI0026019C01|nr:hypothetical protein [Ilumatobacter sp.]MDJ0770106.1 hypothetical protein [Ilumatobacter sp.]
MPFYRVSVRRDLLPESQREPFANDVVDIHCGATGAPRSFVHVLITDAAPTSLPDGQNGSISGTIRSGRTEEQKTQITTRLRQALANRAGVDAATVSAALRDIEASFTMEGGALLPEPGSAEEALWKHAGGSP